MKSRPLIAPATSTPTPARQRNPVRTKTLGFSLVEVLVSIFILTVGILGMVGMQAASLKANREARLQSSAVVLARELADMIRGNKTVGNLPIATNPYLGSFNTVPLAPTTASYCLNVATTTTACANTTAVANAQMTEWLARVDAELPGARVTVCDDTAPFDASGIPKWACTTSAAATAGGAVQVIVIKIGWTRSSTDKSQTGVAAILRTDSADLTKNVPLLVLPVIPGSST